MERSNRLPSGVLRGIALAAALTGCAGSGLSSTAWIWCKEHPIEVDEAAAALQLPIAVVTIAEPTWWPDYLVGAQNATTAQIGANTDFIAACDKAADTAGVGASRQSWCLADGLGAVWTASITLGSMSSTDLETYAYRALPLESRIDDTDFVRACQYAHAPPPSPAAPTS
jgi:hypothetical protein